MNLSEQLRMEAKISEEIDNTDSSVSVMRLSADYQDELAATLETLLNNCSHIQQLPMHVLTKTQAVLARSKETNQ